MNLINTTPVVRKRVKEMVLFLIPEYQYVKVHKSGLVSLKRKRWSLKKTKVNITDLVVGALPTRIAELAYKKGQGSHYNQLFDAKIASLLHVTKYAKQFCIVEYVWKNYVNLCLDAPEIIQPYDPFAIETPRTTLFTLSFNPDRYWYGVLKVIRPKALKPPKWSVLKKINKKL